MNINKGYAIILWSLKALGQKVLALLSGNSFYSSGHRDLDLWSTDPKSIGFFYSIRAIILWSFKAQGLRVLELLSGKWFSLFGSLWPWPLTYWSQYRTGSSTQYEQSPYEVWRLWVNGYLSYWAETDFTLRVTVTLTFDVLTPKSIGVFYLFRAITLWSLKALAQRVLKLLGGNGFHSLGHCDLDLWPTDPKIDRVYLCNKGYQPMKFEGSGSKGTRVIERKRFSLFKSLWPWPLTYWP